MNKATITCADVIESLGSNHEVPNKKVVKKAYLHIENMYSGQTRFNHEPYTLHPLRVAKYIADWGFESDVIVAALLHDLVKEGKSSLEEIEEVFGSTVSNMVNSLSSVNRDLHIENGLTKEALDKKADTHLLRNINEKAFFIIIAERIDILDNIPFYDEDMQLSIAQHTREILIPIAIAEGALQLVDLLEDLCFKIEHKDFFSKISDKYDFMLKDNKYTTSKTVRFFKELFNKDNTSIPSDFLMYQTQIVNFITNPRAIVSIYRQICKLSQNINTDSKKFLNKNTIALYDFTLVFNDGITEPLDIFYKYYERFLAQKNIYILDYGITTYDDCNYIILCDEMDNRYRLFVKTKSEYMRYRLGNIVDTDANLAFVDINEIEPKDTYKDKIKVFFRNGEKCYIDKGATVLDFAFYIHSEIGLHFDYGIINKSKTKAPAHRRLNEGDEIEIFTTENITAQLHWFNCVKTSRATHHLVKYFAEKMKELKGSITQ